MCHFLCTAWRAKGSYRKGPWDGAQFWPLLWRDHCEHGSRPGFPRAAQADRQAGHWATVGAHLLAVLEATASHCRLDGDKEERNECSRRLKKWRLDGADCHWIFTRTFSSFVEELTFTTCCRDGLKFLTCLFVGVCACVCVFVGDFFFLFALWRFLFSFMQNHLSNK